MDFFFTHEQRHQVGHECMHHMKYYIDDLWVCVTMTMRRQINPLGIDFGDTLF